MAFAASRAVTIDATKVAGDLVDFPFLFSGTYDYLATLVNGGQVRNANGYDIAWFADASLTTPLDFELESYVGATGEVILGADPRAVVDGGHDNLCGLWGRRHHQRVRSSTWRVPE